MTWPENLQRPSSQPFDRTAYHYATERSDEGVGNLKNINSALFILWRIPPCVDSRKTFKENEWLRALPPASLFQTSRSAWFVACVIGSSWTLILVRCFRARPSRHVGLCSPMSSRTVEVFLARSPPRPFNLVNFIFHRQ